MVIVFRMWAPGFKAPLAWFFTATAAKCSRVVPKSCMCRRAIIANSEANVLPARISPAQSPAAASISLTLGVGCEVIFSTPTTIATSLMPAATSAQAWKNADPPDAQATSTRVEGAP